MRWALLVLALAGCGDNLYRDLPYFEWNGQRTIGAYEIDALGPTDVHMADEVATAKPGNWVVMFYGHNPGLKASLDTIDALLAQAYDQGLGIFTFADLAAGTADRPGICLSFDDTEVDQWILLRPILAKYQAHVSFFVTEYQDFSDAQRAELHTLYADGNTIEAHGVHHANEVDYVAAHGLDALITDEVKPSIDILVADGFTPVAFAHPGGAHSRAIDEAILPVIPIVRSISGAPKD